MGTSAHVSQEDATQGSFVDPCYVSVTLSREVFKVRQVCRNAATTSLPSDSLHRDAAALLSSTSKVEHEHRPGHNCQSKFGAGPTAATISRSKHRPKGDWKGAANFPLLAADEGSTAAVASLCVTLCAADEVSPAVLRNVPYLHNPQTFSPRRFIIIATITSTNPRPSLTYARRVTTAYQNLTFYSITTPKEQPSYCSSSSSSIM